jgi:DNA-binding NarL/FixJ family response regulator
LRGAQCPGEDERLMIRVLVVDDHAGMRAALAQLLAGAPDVELVGASGDGWGGVKLARELDPDVVLMDISMPGLDGIAATYRLRQDDARTQVLILTAATDPLVVRRARAAGATAVLSKDDDPHRVLDAIRRAGTNGAAP